MVKPRVVETNEGIQGEFTVEIYDKMMRNLRDKGWIETDLITKMLIRPSEIETSSDGIKFAQRLT